MNALDKMISWWAPERGFRRQLVRDAAALTPLKGADTRSRNMRTFVPKLMSRDAQNEGVGGLMPPRSVLAVRAQWLVRNNPLARSAMGSIRDNALGLGLQLQSIPDADALGWDKERVLVWSNDVERRHAIWAGSPDCDSREQSDFNEQQLILLTTTWVKGDCFYMLPVLNRGNGDQLTVNLVEPERVATPPERQADKRIIAGVQKGKYGEAVTYWFADTHPGDDAGGRVIYREEKARDSKGNRRVYHVFLREEIEQTRGESQFQAVLELFNDLGKYSEAELTAAIISAYFTVFASSKGGGSAMAPMNFMDEEGAQSASDKKDMTLGPGLIIESDTDTQFTMANPNRPNAQFDPFVAAVLKQIAVGLGLPMEVLLKHFTSSYSAARAEIQEAWKTYRRARGLVARQFAQPVFEKWLAMEVSAGRIKAPGFFTDPVKRAAYSRTAWTGDQPGSLDPLKEANARRVDMENGVRTLDEACIEATGIGYWEKHDTHAQIAAARTAAGLLTPGAAVPVVEPPEEDTPEEDTPEEDAPEEDAPAEKGNA